MHIIDVLLLVIAGEGDDGLKGGGFLQKKVYFLSVLCEKKFGFTAHCYGPYSDFVAEHLDSLVNYGLIEEVRDPFTIASGETNDFGETRSHTYHLTRDGKKIWETIQQKPEFPKWNEALQTINNQKISKDFNELSIAAKAHYVFNWPGQRNFKEICQVVEKYNSNGSTDCIESFLASLSKLELAGTDKSHDTKSGPPAIEEPQLTEEPQPIS